MSSSHQTPNPPPNDWTQPLINPEAKTIALKLPRKGTCAAEIQFLKDFRHSPCAHLPEVVWVADSCEGFAMVPCGKPITGLEPASVQRSIISGVLDGLKFLHGLFIIHRDVRISNLVINPQNQEVVIVDYETATKTTVGAQDQMHVDGEGGNVDMEYYKGGLICCPQRILSDLDQLYVPRFADDLHAVIIVALTLLFYRHFQLFADEMIGVKDSREAQAMIQLWKDLEESAYWSPFLKLADERAYGDLKKMGEFYYHV